MKTRFAAIAILLLLVVACQSLPPAPAPAREATVVAASFTATWDAAIDHFAEDNIPISTIERASGLIATSRLSVGLGTATMASDCGAVRILEQVEHTRARFAVYNILVRGDERSSTVRVTVAWSNPDAEFECVTTGAWEKAAEEVIRMRAEGGGERPEEIAVEPEVEPEVEPLYSILFTGAPFAVPRWAGVIAQKGGRTFYPLTDTCKGWYHLSEDDVRYFASEELARRQGLIRSSAVGCRGGGG